MDIPECFVNDLHGEEEDDDDDSLARTPRPSDSQYSSLSSRGSCLSTGPPGYGAPEHPNAVFATTSHNANEPLLIHRPEVPPRIGSTLSRTRLAPDGTLESVEELTSTV